MGLFDRMLSGIVGGKKMSRVYCSICGCSHELSLFDWSVEDFIADGWHSAGNMFYCPFCSHSSKKMDKQKTTARKLSTLSIMGDYI